MVSTDQATYGYKPSPEVVDALATIRERIAGKAWAAMPTDWELDVAEAFNILDNEGVFREIDEATGYDINPAPYLPLGDPAEMGDLVAKVTLVTTDKSQTVRCTQHGDIACVYGKNMPNFADGWYDEHIAEHENAQPLPDDASLAGYSTKAEMQQQITRGVEQARRGETRDLGDFSQYLHKD